MAWIFFRAENVTHAKNYILTIFSKTLFTFPEFKLGRLYAFEIFIMILIMLLIEWNGRDNKYALEKMGLQWNRYIRLTFYFSIILLIFMFFGREQEFIYFQF